jgi:hypothetical protein
MDIGEKKVMKERVSIRRENDEDCFLKKEEVIISCFLKFDNFHFKLSNINLFYDKNKI